MTFVFSFSFFQRVNSLCFNPDGTQLLAAIGTRILVYDTADGALKSALSGKVFFSFALFF